MWDISVLTALAILTATPLLAGVKPVTMQGANPEQTATIRQLLGEEFIKGDGPFPSELEAADIDLNGDGVPDMIITQRGFCSNHACSNFFFLRTGTGWRYLTKIENWEDIYILPPKAGTMKRIVFFDHVTDDCDACSPPQPVWMNWHNEVVNTSGASGDYVRGDVLTKLESSQLTPSSRPVK